MTDKITKEQEAPLTLEELLAGKGGKSSTFSDWVIASTDAVERITQLEERVKVLEDAAKERIHYGVPLTDISFDIQSGSDRQITVCVFESMRKQLKYLAALAGGKDGV